MKARRFAALLAAVSSLAVAFGVALIYLPAGVITAGLVGLASAYIIGYLGAKREVS